MVNYFYVIMTFVACGCLIIHDVYLFSNDKYKPCKILTYKYNVVESVAFIVMVWSFTQISHTTRPPVLIGVLLIVVLFVYSSILDYLYYVKNKDRKKIYLTVIFNITFIALSYYVFGYIILRKG